MATQDDICDLDTKIQEQTGARESILILIYRHLLLANRSSSQDMETGRMLWAGELLTAQSRPGVNRRP